jgi:F-type H+-transporting ATPase subunit a
MRDKPRDTYPVSLPVLLRGGSAWMLVPGAALSLCAAGDDPGTVLLHHVTDSHVWAPVPFIPPIVLHDLHVGAITVPVTAHVVMLWINAFVLSVVLIAALGRVRLAPGALSAAIEPLVFFVRDALVRPAIGEALTARWLPFFCTLFFFILSSNLLGIIPLFPTVTGNLSVTLGLAIMVFVTVLSVGIVRSGVGGFFANLIPEGIPLPMGVFIAVLESMSLVIRNGVLAIRLFANMIAGHFVIASLLILMIIVHPLAGTVSVPLALFIDLLEVLVAIIQAVVFTLLAAIFIGMAGARH